MAKMTSKSLIYTVLKDKDADSTIIQIIRYFIVGFASIAVDFFFLILSTELLNIYYLLSAAIGFLAGLTTNYILTTLWVFNKRKLDNKMLEIFIYFLTGLLGITLTELIIWFFTENIHFHYAVSKGISFVTVYMVNFFIRKHLLFK